MSIITISADYYGKAIRKVQRKDNISVAQFAHLLDCDAKQLRNYIFGVDLIPYDKL